MDNRARILVVDDERELCDLYAEVLEEQGYSVLKAGNGQEALQILQGGPVDLIILDLVMPQMSGQELLKQAGVLGLDLDFIILTAFGSVEMAVQCIKLGAADFLVKPFVIDQLLVRVEKAVRERRLRAERKELGDLVRILDLSHALNCQKDLPSLMREFLCQLRDTFSPDGIMLYLRNGQDGREGRTGRGGPGGAERRIELKVASGRLLKESSVLRHFQAISLQAFAEGKPRIVEPIKDITGQEPRGMAGLGGIPCSALSIPLVSSRSKLGVVTVIRGPISRSYTVSELQLLTVFSTHASVTFERARAHDRMKDMTSEIIMSYARAVEAKDIYTRGHSERVGDIAERIGRRMKLSSRELAILRRAGILHDIGKIGIPDNILNKPSALTKQEFEVMKTHPSVGRDILSRVRSFGDVLPVIYHHHERMDGGGYPLGLSGDEIPFLSRIVSVADGFEAMSSDRAYHAGRPVEEIKRVMIRNAGTQWDADVVKTCLAMCDEFPPVALSAAG